MFANSARLRPRLLGSALAAVTVFVLLPSSWPSNSRYLVSWDIGVVLYLVFAARLAGQFSTEAIRKQASVEDEGALAILILTVCAALASLAAIGAQLYGIHEERGAEQAFRLVLSGVTILCSWFFVHTIWAIHYAHEFYGDEGERRGLVFPHEGQPDYWDFLYFSFNMGAAAQTSDVMVVSRKMRRLVLGHTILSFLFNTMILALAVNVGASLI
ncbi:DUF1345 domain-containing protein [Microvirga brassicacearum]|uniref:DUF1345 domain-containing protein n=1 Tax=Microvirga brassicacearum TaxID=2580413 RepID=A0A5N3PFH0_9HYPH|nr:DUF1345 domain-containing protein [Microvirga brassicacearum]KAB0268454.1 DUF1345 domain-containing protein [Microvirga brassicacearum]